MTVAAIGPKYSPSHPDWVSYLVKKNGKWIHSTIFTVPANSVIHVTIYQYDGDTGLRNPFLSQVQGTIGGTETVDGKTVNSITPKKPRTRSSFPSWGCSSRCRACRKKPRTSANSRRAKAPRTHGRIQLPHGQEGPLPLAVLRALRGRLPLRPRRPDADAGLHGRVPECRLTRRLRPREGRANRTTRSLRDDLGASATLIAMPLVICVIGPLIGPGNGSEQASGQVTDDTVLAAMATPVLHAGRHLPALRLIFFRQPKGGALEGPAVRGHARLQTTWIVVTSRWCSRSRSSGPCGWSPTTAPARAAGPTR